MPQHSLLCCSNKCFWIPITPPACFRQVPKKKHCTYFGQSCVVSSFRHFVSCIIVGGGQQTRPDEDEVTKQSIESIETILSVGARHIRQVWEFNKFVRVLVCNCISFLSLLSTGLPVVSPVCCFVCVVSLRYVGAVGIDIYVPCTYTTCTFLFNSVTYQQRLSLFVQGDTWLQHSLSNHGHLLKLSILATPVTLCQGWQSGSNIRTVYANAACVSWC